MTRRRSRTLRLDPNAESASPDHPAFVAKPEGAPVYYGFPFVPETETEGWLFGGVVIQPTTAKKYDGPVREPPKKRASSSLRVISARNVLVLLTLAAVVAPASAEVMDKELSVPQVWAWGSLGALAGVLAIRHRWWLGLLSLPIAALGPVRALAEFQDPYVGPAIAREAGSAYGPHAVIALIVVLAAHAATWAAEYHVETARRCSLPTRTSGEEDGFEK